jgi:hypothetical protein
MQYVFSQQVLTLNYNYILTEFMQDDHEITYSVASLAVQIFTVPSLAIYLIENDDVIFTILNSFYNNCTGLCGLREFFSADLILWSNVKSPTLS